MTDRTIDQADAAAHGAGALSLLSGLRPQPFSSGNPSRVDDPIVEPLWTGVRVLAAVDGGRAALADDAGQPIEGQPDVVAALAEAALAESVVVDGFLTKLAAPEGTRAYVAMDSLPSAGQMVARPLLGIRPTHAEDAIRAREAASAARTFGPDDTVRMIVTDLLWLDGESLLDIPLLERRRVLESVIAESDLIRRGIFVRPPIETWLGSWRSMGFEELVFKGANSRYQPGTPSQDWVVLPMPRR